MNKVLFFLATSCCGAEAPHETEVLTYAKQHFPSSGVLKNTNGFVYLDISDRFIHELVPLIQESGFETPPYFGKESLAGAHISVIFPEELKDVVIDECGKRFSFQLTKCITLFPEQFKGVVEFYFLIVEAPELNDLREKYGLAKCEYNFHITIGIKQKCPLTLDASGHFQTTKSLD